MKTCRICKETKPFTDYYPRSARCKSCCIVAVKKWKADNRKKALEHQRISNKNRRSKRLIECNIRRKRVKQATPKLVDKNELKYIYTLANEKNLVVDHIIPLKHKLVCGLNVPDNLRCIPMQMNATKSNKFDQETASVHAAVAASFGLRGLANWKK